MDGTRRDPPFVADERAMLDEAARLAELLRRPRG